MKRERACTVDSPGHIQLELHRATQRLGIWNGRTAACTPLGSPCRVTEGLEETSAVKQKLAKGTCSGVAAGCGVSQERTITCISLPLRHARTCLRERSEGRARQTSVRVLSREALCLDIHCLSELLTPSTAFDSPKAAATDLDPGGVDASGFSASVHS